MQVQERIVSIKRHTIGYVVNGSEWTRAEAVREARLGRINNARVINNSVYGAHLVGTGRTNLYELPTRFAKSRRFANKRAK